MSKRWKVRQRNAAKLESSREIVGRYYDNVTACLKQVAWMTFAMTDQEKQGNPSPKLALTPRKNVQ